MRVQIRPRSPASVRLKFTPGLPGAPNKLSIGTVTTLEPGQPANANITGASPNQVLNLGIPRGTLGNALPAGTSAAPNLAPAASPSTGLLLSPTGMFFATGGNTPFYVTASSLTWAPNGVARLQAGDSSFQMHHDNIPLGTRGNDPNIARRWFNPNITWKLPDDGTNGGFDIPLFTISASDATNAANNNGQAAVAIQAGWNLPLEFYTNIGGFTTQPNGSKLTNGQVRRLRITGDTSIATATWSETDVRVNRVNGGSVAANLYLDAENAATGKTSTLRLAAQDNNAGTIRALLLAPGALNAGVKDQGRLDILTENGVKTIAVFQSDAASGGSQFSLHDRAGSGAAQIILRTNAASSIQGGGLEVTGGGVGLGTLAPTASWAAIPASTTARASINAAPGVAPTSPANGDLWNTSAGWFARVGGATRTFAFLETLTKADVGLGNVDNVSAANLRDRSTHTGTQAISTVSGLQAALDAKQDIPGAGTAYTPAIGATSGTITAASLLTGRYHKVGRIVFVTIFGRIDTAGTASGALTFSVPFIAAAAGPWIFTGYEGLATNAQLRGRVLSGGAVIEIVRYDGATVIADGRSAFITGWYEAAA